MQDHSNTLDKIAAAISSVMPQQLGDDIKKNLRASLESVFDRLDLITREELEVQEAVLARTRAKLEELENKIATLEQTLEKK